MDVLQGGPRLTPVSKREWVCAITGLALTLFVLAHLTGILRFFAGPVAFEAYAAQLKEVPAAVGIVRFAFTAALFIHVVSGGLVFLRDRSAREARCAALGHGSRAGQISLALLFTGLVILFVVPSHLKEFTFAAVRAARTGGPGLYEIVHHAFLSPLHTLAYVFFVLCVGFHLAFSRIWTTLGCLDSRSIRNINYAARTIGLLVVAGFAAVPLLVLLRVV